MPRKPFILIVATLGALSAASPSAAQVQVGDWTERPDARASLDACAPLWHWTAVQGLALMAVVLQLPRWLGA